MFADLLKAFSKSEFAVGDIDQFQIGSDEVLVGGNQVEAVKFSRDHGFFGRCVPEQYVVETRPGRIFGYPETRGGVALGIRVYDENPEVIGSQCGGKINSGSGFPNSAFLVSDREDSAQAAILACLVFQAETVIAVSRETDRVVMVRVQAPVRFDPRRSLKPKRDVHV